MFYGRCTRRGLLQKQEMWRREFYDQNKDGVTVHVVTWTNVGGNIENTNKTENEPFIEFPSGEKVKSNHNLTFNSLQNKCKLFKNIYKNPQRYQRKLLLSTFMRIKLRTTLQLLTTRAVINVSGQERRPTTPSSISWAYALKLFLF